MEIRKDIDTDCKEMFEEDDDPTIDIFCDILHRGDEKEYKRKQIEKKSRMFK